MEIQKFKQKITELVDGFFSDPEYLSYFVVDVQLNNKKLLIFIDGDDSVSYTICRKTSRHIEAILDEKKWLGEQYVIEVSSPGAEKALKNPRQFKKHIGRKAAIKFKDSEVEMIEAKIVSIDGDKMKLSNNTEIEIEDIMELKIILSF